jgi:hypothetical protein
LALSRYSQENPDIVPVHIATLFAQWMRNSSC